MADKTIPTLKILRGSVGIGTTAPAAKLHVNGTTILGDVPNNDWGANHAIGLTSNNGLLMSEAGVANNTNRLFLFYNAAGSPRLLMYQGNTTQKVAIDTNGVTHFSGGSVGIGTTAPSSTLEVNGTITESSSIAIKENIFDFNTTLDKINRVRPVRFNKKTNKNKKEIGLIAEELAEIFPELVENDENGNPTSVNYTRAVTVLFDGFKQMYKELKEIKEKIK